MHTVLHRLGDSTGQLIITYPLPAPFFAVIQSSSAHSQRYHACSNRSIEHNQAPRGQKFTNVQHFIVVHSSSLPLKSLQHKDIHDPCSPLLPITDFALRSSLFTLRPCGTFQIYQTLDVHYRSPYSKASYHLRTDTEQDELDRSMPHIPQVHYRRTCRRKTNRNGCS